jgi:hypothetical protein
MLKNLHFTLYPMLKRVFAFSYVVADFDCKDYAAACAGDGVGNEHGPNDATGVQYALQHECEGAYCHHEERGKGNAVGIACAYGGYGLWQIAKYEPNACHIAADGVES